MFSIWDCVELVLRIERGKALMLLSLNKAIHDLLIESSLVVVLVPYGTHSTKGETVLGKCIGSMKVQDRAIHARQGFKRKLQPVAVQQNCWFFAFFSRCIFCKGLSKMQEAAGFLLQ
ncbi:uncharacterized protein LOC132622237 [Lycium barbarum]|uniref:uncharacterized protein LOC132622237 n=1 Tax=Lycium barbarum TaxID=112863 RepID=UPI00293F1440|nr:uncharacterized protein LOC132622237 [Lycium barbarum]